MCDTYTWRKAKHILKKDDDRKGSVEKLSLAVSLKGVDAKTNWWAVNR
jgi:hypothetical protein